MADGEVDRAISSLPLATAINLADLFVLEQNGEAKALSGQLLTEFIDRNILGVTVHDLSYGSTPTADYDRITGNLSLGIPKGNSIVSITLNANDQVVYTWADGTSFACERIKGDTGRSAYDIAVENGYTGSESDFESLQIGLANSAQAERDREEAEANRQSNYTYMMGRVEQKLTELNNLVDNTATAVTGTTLVLNTIGTSVVDTTLML